VHFLLLPFLEANGAAGLTRLLIIGIGNPNCGDDAIGPLVAQRLVGRLPPEVTIFDRTGDMLGLIEEWSGRDGVVLVDAAKAVASPGTIHRIDLLRESLPAGMSLASTHAFGLTDAVELARALDQLPARLVVYAVVGERFDPGAPQSPAMSKAAEVVAERVVLEVIRMSAEVLRGRVPTGVIMDTPDCLEPVKDPYDIARAHSGWASEMSSTQDQRSSR
jgi:hydrogenase maturation protease